VSERSAGEIRAALVATESGSPYESESPSPAPSPVPHAAGAFASGWVRASYGHESAGLLATRSPSSPVLHEVAFAVVGVAGSRLLSRSWNAIAHILLCDDGNALPRHAAR